MLRVEVVQAALAQRKSQIESHGPSPFKRQSLRQKQPTELEEGMLDIRSFQTPQRKYLLSGREVGGGGGGG